MGDDNEKFYRFTDEPTMLCLAMRAFHLVNGGKRYDTKSSGQEVCIHEGSICMQRETNRLTDLWTHRSIVHDSVKIKS